MKKIYKYIRDAETPSLQEELKRYTQLSQAFRSQPNKKVSKKQSPLSLIIPFAAASLSPFAINAQCSATQSVGPGIGNGEHILVDIDGDGDTDVELDVTVSMSGPTGHDLYAIPQGGAQILAYSIGGFFYGSRLATGAAISSANPNWQSPAFVVLDYNELNGGWEGSGTVQGFLAVKVGTQLGFINVSWTEGTANVDVDNATSGLQTLDNASEMSVQAGVCSSLPVELINFSGHRNSDYAVLEWTTASEQDNKGFEVQRSSNGINFQTVGFVAGQGNSSTEIDYTFKDEGIRKGVDYYYRLKQLDFWGRSEASEVINLKALESATRLTVAPNPAGEFINISYQSEGNSSAQLTVFDVRGQQLMLENLDADSKSNFELNIQELPAGSYFLKVEEADSVEYKQFIKS